jgi:hypothetical protein
VVRCGVYQGSYGLSVAWQGVARLSLSVAGHAHHRQVIELSEAVCQAILLLKLVFARIAPGLEVSWVTTVFDETGRRTVLADQVTADDSSNPVAMRPAVNHYWFGIRHALSALNARVDRAAEHSK